jgi:hypothetical protein
MVPRQQPELNLLKVNTTFPLPDLPNQPRDCYQIIGEGEAPLGDAMPTNLSLKPNEWRGIEILPNSSTKLGFQPKSFNWRQNSEFGDQDQTQRCMKQLSMIPTNKSKPKHLRIEGTSRARKTDENSLKKTRKSNELQTGNRRNHECFHSLEGQILYKRRKNLNLESKENEKQSGWIVCLETLELIYEFPPGQAKDHTTPST